MRCVLERQTAERWSDAARSGFPATAAPDAGAAPIAGWRTCAMSSKGTYSCYGDNLTGSKRVDETRSA